MPCLGIQACGQFYTEEKLVKALMVARKRWELEQGRRLPAKQPSFAQKLFHSISSGISSFRLESAIRESAISVKAFSSAAMTDDDDAASSGEDSIAGPKRTMRTKNAKKDNFTCSQARRVVKEMMSRHDEMYGVVTFHFEEIDVKERHRNETGAMYRQVSRCMLALLSGDCTALRSPVFFFVLWESLASGTTLPSMQSRSRHSIGTMRICQSLRSRPL